MQKLTLTYDELAVLLRGKTRLSKKMAQALALVLCDGYSYIDAAKLTGIKSSQLLGRRARELRQSYLEEYCPNGWKRAVIYYPPKMQEEIDLLKSKIAVEKIRAK